MKKFYFLAASALLATSLQAQDLTFYMGDKVIEPGTTVYSNEGEIESDFFQLDPHLSIVSATGGTIDYIKAECTSGVKVQMCCGGMCEMGETVTKTNIEAPAGEKVDLQFEAMGFEAAPQDITTNISAAKGNEVVAFTIIMNYDEASVTIMKADETVRYNGSALLYNVNESSTITVYDAAGHKVMGAGVNGNGSIATDQLAKGVYLYNIRGAVNKSGKILVK